MSGPNVEDYTPGWTKVEDDRWRRSDELGVMHLLLKDTPPCTDAQRAELTRFFELHGLTLHIYRGPADVVDDAWPLGNPSKKYDSAVHNFSHVGTDDVSSTVVARYTDEADAWAWLARYGVKYGR